MKMIKTSSLLSLFALCVGSFNLLAQDVKDPEAAKLLKKIKHDFDAASTMEITFDLDMTYPGEESRTQNGKLKQKGEKYHVQTDDFVIISDGKTLWFINKVNKEGQINNAGEDDGFSLFSPIELLKIYERDDHNFAITNKYTERGKSMSEIEFTPLDKMADYFKARLKVASASGAISEVIFFYRDGSRLTLSIKEIAKNKALSDDVFSFNASKFPDVYMEDLRM